MKMLIKKEIRLLLPAWITAMLLAVVPRPFIILCSPGNPTFYQGSISSIAESIFAIGLLILGINSFGQELTCNTFSALLSQPMKRPRLWLIKVGTLAIAFISVWLTAVLIARWQFGIFDGWDTAQYVRPEFSDAFEFLTLSALVVFSGGLWTTLLFRQLSGAFWFTLLTPLAIIVGIVTVFQNWAGWGEKINTFIAAALVLYSVAGFFLARRLFMRAQDVQWTGGEVSLRFGKGATKASWRRGSVALPVRTRHWFSPLAWKEVQLHQATFLIAAPVLALHLTACLIRRFHPHIENATLDFALGNFWILWLMMPLLIGAASIAEERRMGTLEPQLCLPVSRSVQLFFKFSIALFLSVFFGAAMPALIEISICGANLGESGVWVITRNDVTPDQWHWVFVVAAAIFYVSFYASSLRRAALQGIGLAILAAAIYSFEAWIHRYEAWQRMGLVIPAAVYFENARFGLELLRRYLDPPVLVLVLGWLTFANFKHTQQNWKFWLRNIAAILAVFICVPVLARAVYYRPWEVFLPLEPRGPVQIQSPSQVKFVATYRAIYAVSPDGRLRIAPYTYNLNHVDSGRGQFIGGSNWVDVAVSDVETLAVQSDGTLWSVGGNCGPAIKTQIGTDNDWLHVASGMDGFLILKKDGSLWSWGTLLWSSKTNMLREPQLLRRDVASPPVRVSHGTNWTALYSTHLFSPYARDQDGNLWLLAGNHLKRETNVDYQWLSLQFDESLSHVEVQTNGDLCYIDRMWFIQTMIMRQHALHRSALGRGGPDQLGEPWKWKTAAFGHINGWQTIVAIRSDGTLWKFPLRQAPKFSLEPPVQLGTRSDWVAVSQGFSLASDGSIWTWDRTQRLQLARSIAPAGLCGQYFSGIGELTRSSFESARRGRPGPSRCLAGNRNRNPSPDWSRERRRRWLSS
jgi:hypothetical protein